MVTSYRAVFGKQITSIPNNSNKYWYTNNNGEITNKVKSTDNDLKNIYTYILLNGNSEICESFNSPMKGGSSIYRI